MPGRRSELFLAPIAALSIALGSATTLAEDANHNSRRLGQAVQTAKTSPAGRRKSKAMSWATTLAIPSVSKTGVMKVSYDQYKQFDRKYGPFSTKTSFRATGSALNIAL